MGVASGWCPGVIKYFLLYVGCRSRGMCAMWAMAWPELLVYQVAQRVLGDGLAQGDHSEKQRLPKRLTFTMICGVFAVCHKLSRIEVYNYSHIRQETNNRILLNYKIIISMYVSSRCTEIGNLIIQSS